MKTNAEIFNEFCDKHDFCNTCGFAEHDSCAWDRDEYLRYSIEILMELVRRDCKGDVLYSTTDFELEEELGKD